METKSYQTSADPEKTPLLADNAEPTSHPSLSPPPQSSFFTRTVQPCLAEFLGTTIIVFVASLSQQNAPDLQLPSAVGTGLTYAAMYLAFARLSGGHFNPAVTLGSLAAGGPVPVVASLAYVVTQLVGGVLGAALTWGCLNYPGQVKWVPQSNETVYYQIMGGAVTLSPGVTVGAGILVEFLCTFIYVTVMLMMTLDLPPNPTTGLALGFTIVFSMNSGGYVTECGMNPARSLGPALLVGGQRPEAWTHHYVYWVGPLLGGLAAGLIYRLLYASDQRRVLFNKKSK